MVFSYYSLMRENTSIYNKKGIINGNFDSFSLQDFSVCLAQIPIRMLHLLYFFFHLKVWHFGSSIKNLSMPFSFSSNPVGPAGRRTKLCWTEQEEATLRVSTLGLYNPFYLHRYPAPSSVAQLVSNAHTCVSCMLTQFAGFSFRKQWQNSPQVTTGQFRGSRYWITAGMCSTGHASHPTWGWNGGTWRRKQAHDRQSNLSLPISAGCAAILFLDNGLNNLAIVPCAF